MLTCRELTDFLLAFLNGELDPFRRSLFLKHLERCNDCGAYLASYRATVALERRACADPEDSPLERGIPETFVRSVVAALRDSGVYLWNLLAAVAASPLLFFYFGGK